MAIGCMLPEAVAASLLGASPHSFHGSNAEFPGGRPSVLKCPFVRAVLSLKATFRSSTSNIQVNSAKFTTDLHQSANVTAKLQEQESSYENEQSDTLAESATDISRVLPEGNSLGFPVLDSLPGPGIPGFQQPDAASFQARYANRKSSILVLGLSVHSTPVEMREKLAVSEADWASSVEELCTYPHIQEAGILSTCNRLEIYVSALSWHMGMVEVLDWMSHKSGIASALLREHVFVLQSQDASKHLLRVACGLDSLVLGEGQILSQVKQVMQVGQSVQGFGRHLTGLFKQAIIAGKRVRSETSIGTGAVSVSSAAVELAAKKVSNVSLKDLRICIIGAGKMAKLLVKHLISKGCTSMLVLNRSEARMQELGSLFPDAVLTFEPLHELARCIGEADVVFTCTASDRPLIDKSTVEGLPCATGKRHFVDISVPRNVSASVEKLDSAVVYNVDDLEEVVAGNKEERARKAMEAQSIIEEELKSFEAWQDSLETVPTIKKLRAYAEKIRMGELEKYLGKMGDGLSNKDKKLVDDLSRAIVNKLLHGPMVHLRGDGPNGSCRAEALESMHALERMFDLHSETLPLVQKSNKKANQVR
eukprot:c32983_g1_i1 orf=175-1950(-)